MDEDVVQITKESQNRGAPEAQERERLTTTKPSATENAPTETSEIQAPVTGPSATVAPVEVACATEASVAEARSEETAETKPSAKAVSAKVATVTEASATETVEKHEIESGGLQTASKEISNDKQEKLREESVEDDDDQVLGFKKIVTDNKQLKQGSISKKKTKEHDIDTKTTKTEQNESKSKKKAPAKVKALEYTVETLISLAEAVNTFISSEGRSVIDWKVISETMDGPIPLSPKTCSELWQNVTSDSVFAQIEKASEKVDDKEEDSKAKRPRKWTHEENALLRDAVKKYGANWDEVGKVMKSFGCERPKAALRKQFAFIEKIEGIHSQVMPKKEVNLSSPAVSEKNTESVPEKGTILSRSSSSMVEKNTIESKRHRVSADAPKAGVGPAAAATMGDEEDDEPLVKKLKTSTTSHKGTTKNGTTPDRLGKDSGIARQVLVAQTSHSAVASRAAETDGKQRQELIATNASNDNEGKRMAQSGEVHQSSYAIQSPTFGTGAVGHATGGWPPPMAYTAQQRIFLEMQMLRERELQQQRASLQRNHSAGVTHPAQQLPSSAGVLPNYFGYANLLGTNANNSMNGALFDANSGLNKAQEHGTQGFGLALPPRSSLMATHTIEGNGNFVSSFPRSQGYFQQSSQVHSGQGEQNRERQLDFVQRQQLHQLCQQQLQQLRVQQQQPHLPVDPSLLQRSLQQQNDFERQHRGEHQRTQQTVSSSAQSDVCGNDWWWQWQPFLQLQQAQLMQSRLWKSYQANPSSKPLEQQKMPGLASSTTSSSSSSPSGDSASSVPGMSGSRWQKEELERLIAAIKPYEGKLTIEWSKVRESAGLNRSINALQKQWRAIQKQARKIKLENVSKGSAENIAL